MKRQRLTRFEFASLFLVQAGRCGCGCGQKLEAGQVDEEHSKPVALDGDPKPDSLWRRDCHKVKTRGDVKIICKAERQAGRKGQYARRKRNGPQVKSRGFSKSLRRKFNGTVERNER